MGNIIAIVGRPNVGKSTLFNRLTESREAIVDEMAGVTRDRHYGKSVWNGVEFSVIDTGGYVIRSGDIYEDEIRKQVLLAIEESDIILFLVDVTGGITDLDEGIARMLRKTEKIIYLVVNKVDNPDRAYDTNEFYKLGMGEIYPLSAINGSGTGELLDDLVRKLPRKPDEDLEDIPKFAIIGRPNVGKSSLANALLGEERNIVTPLSGTTRDSIYSRYRKYNYDFYIVDTAGLRKKGKVTENVEFYSVMRSIRSIENADVCLTLIDSTRGMEGQDVNIISLVKRNRKGIVLLVNKWDLIEKDTKTLRLFREKIIEKIAPFRDIPIIFTSAITRQRLHKVLETAIRVYENRKKKVPTGRLNNSMLEAIENNPPPAVKGKQIKIKYVVQLPTLAPSFAFFCNLPQYIKEPYKRYLENRIREHFDFTGVPIQIFFRKK
ncbi:MAG: ribosome biogenesis GTPase Der [Bacteroidales bacterium]|nr:MAG: ribosome biogenesis GTPase Der [Bacteroidales bacterium]